MEPVITSAGPAGVDTLTMNANGSFTGMGEVAMKLLQSGFNVNSLRNNTVLRNRDWIEVDRALVEIARQRLVGIADLQAAGLTYPIANALGITRVEWEDVSDFGDAQMNMSGVEEDTNERVKFSLQALPLPIIHKGFNINIRALMASRNSGQPLDTTQVTLAGKIVAEKVESILFAGGGTFGSGQTIYGFSTFTPAYTSALTYNWALGTTTGEHRVLDLITIITALQASPNFSYGPYMVYMPHAWYMLLSEDYKANGDRTMLERLMLVTGVKGIRPSHNLTDHMVVVQYTRDVIDLVEGLQPTIVSWDSHGGMVAHFKIMTIMVPRFKHSQTSQQALAYVANGSTTP